MSQNLKLTPPLPPDVVDESAPTDVASGIIFAVCLGLLLWIGLGLSYVAWRLY